MFGLPKFGDGIGLHRVERFFQAHRIDRAALARRSIAVTGTNGKGSTARFITSAVEAAGLRVGCFTSPHLFDVRERFMLGDDMIPQADFERHAETVLAFNRSLPEGDKIGSFEFLFLLAILWFQQEKPDAIVWEAGIGGRYDPVRSVCASVSVLTSIELEHTELLGATEELIAYDKSDVVAPGGCVILSPSINDALAVRIAAYAHLSGKITLPATASRRIGPVVNTPKGARFTYGFSATTPAADQPVRLRLAGQHQVDNAVTGLRAAEVWLGLKPEENAERHIAMLTALGRTRWPGRLEKVASAPDLWIDVGHTPKALEAVTRTFLEFSPRDKTLVVFGVSASKEVAAIAQTVAGRFDHFILTRAHKAGADVGLFAETFRKHSSDVTLAADTSEAARLAKERALREGMSVLALGGLFLSAEIQRAWNGGDPTSLEFL
jgi:dihydrofolate synthase/folylpolyglutamate synthase